MKTRKFKAIVIIGLIMIPQLFTSCFWGIRGNGKIVKSQREAKNFNSIKISSGLDLILTQDTLEKVLVESDENLQKIIRTEVSGGELKIYTTQSIFNASRSKIHVNFKNLKEVHASSGSDVKCTSKLNFQDFKVEASSGADIDLSVSCTNLKVENSSGSDVSLSGNAIKLIVDSSSGSDVNAEKMESETCSADASSGSDVKISVSKRIQAHASSGADITVVGKPVERDIHESSGGDVRFR
jgi:hypothetical protein